METKQKKWAEEKEEIKTASDPFSPTSPVEKPALPLNNLKMRFEKGKSKVRTSQNELRYCTCLFILFIFWYVVKQPNNDP